MRIYLRAGAIVAGLTGFAFLLPALAGQQPNPNPTPAGTGQPPLPMGIGQPPPLHPMGGAIKQPGKHDLTVKVFKLKRAEPETLIAGLNSLLGDSDKEITAAPAAPAAPMPPGPGPGAPGPGPFPMGGTPGTFPPGAFPSGGGGVGVLGGPNTQLVPAWRATVNDRTKSVIVRGSEKHLKIAADLVALIDRPANTPLPQLQEVKAFALKHADAEDLIVVINALEFDDVKLANLDDKLLAVIAPDDVVKSIAELVKELDVPEAAPAPEPKKDRKP